MRGGSSDANKTGRLPDLIVTAVPDGSSRRHSDEWLDRVARFVSSEPFAVAFVWWAVLVALAPLCVVCALGVHASGAVEAGIALALFGLVLGLVSLYRLLSLALLPGRTVAG